MNTRQQIEELINQLGILKLVKLELSSLIDKALEENTKRVREEEKERIKKEYGYMNDGCGCCSYTDLKTELDKEALNPTLSSNDE